jgi:hypothetical protein
MWPTLLRTAAGRLLKNRLGVLRRSSESPLSLLILRAHRDRSRSITGHHPHLSLAFSPGFLSLFTHLSQQLVERAIGENPTELRAKITDETDDPPAHEDRQSFRLYRTPAFPCRSLRQNQQRRKQTLPLCHPDSSSSCQGIAWPFP